MDTLGNRQSAQIKLPIAHSLYKPHEVCLNGKTALMNWDELAERKRQLQQLGFRVLYFWECKVLERLKMDLEMAEFFDEQEEQVGPLFPRDAFQVGSNFRMWNTPTQTKGGRTGPCALKMDLEEAGVTEDYEISAYDVVSLYPSVNFNALYPLGHPHVFDIDEPVEWHRPEQMLPYKGIFKVFLLPPDDLYLPVVAEKIQGKLIFHLCHRCATNAPYGESIRLEHPYTPEFGHTRCPHTDKQRGWVCTLAGVELELALARRYRVTHLYQVYHWDEWSDQLLCSYVKDMMRIKIQVRHCFYDI
jgi:hypothetical protein